MPRCSLLMICTQASDDLTSKICIIRQNKSGSAHKEITLFPLDCPTFITEITRARYIKSRKMQCNITISSKFPHQKWKQIKTYAVMLPCRNRPYQDIGNPGYLVIPMILSKEGVNPGWRCMCREKQLKKRCCYKCGVIKCTIYITTIICL